MTRRYFSKARPTSPFAMLILTPDRRMKRRAPACRREATLWFRRIRLRKCVQRMQPPLNGPTHLADDAACEEPRLHLRLWGLGQFRSNAKHHFLQEPALHVTVVALVRSPPHPQRCMSWDAADCGLA